MLLTIPALFSADEVREFRAVLEQADWTDGRITAGHRAVDVKDNQQLDELHPVAKGLGDKIIDRLSRTPLYIAATLPLRIYPPRFNRYQGGGTYGNHVDSAIFPILGTALRLRTDISTTLFFSDPDEYEGGDLVIEDTYGEQRVKLAAGDMVLYPGNSLHRVEPVTRGTRYASFFWTQSLVKTDANRRQLFELDCAIQSLAADHPGHESINGLTNVYHNLLRQWSDT